MFVLVKSEKKMDNQKIKLIIVDDHQEFINAVKIFLRSRSDIEVVGEANNATQFNEIIETIISDIVLMDINLPDIDGLTTGEKALLMESHLKVLGVTMSDDFNIHNNMLQVGFAGGILKNNFTQDFDKAINKIIKGEVYFPILNS